MGNQLLQNRVSNNVGVVNQYWHTLQHALEEERHFALAQQTIRAGKLEGSIEIDTDDRDFPTIKIPVTGRVF
jgi:hypothetical protein